MFGRDLSAHTPGTLWRIADTCRSVSCSTTSMGVHSHLFKSRSVFIGTLWRAELEPIIAALLVLYLPWMFTLVFGNVPKRADDHKTHACRVKQPPNFLLRPKRSSWHDAVTRLRDLKIMTWFQWERKNVAQNSIFWKTLHFSAMWSSISLKICIQTLWNGF